MQHIDHKIDQMQWLDELAGRPGDERPDERLDKQLAELATLQEIGRQLNARLELGHVMQTTIEWAMHTTCAISGTISLLDQAKTQDRERASGVVHTGEAVVINDVPCAPPDPGPDAAPRPTFRVGRGASGIEPTVTPCSYLVTPIKRQEKIVGLISLQSMVPDGFTAAHVSFLARMADLAAIAIENALLYEQMNRRIAELEALRKADQAAIAIKNAQFYAEMQHAQDAKHDFISAALHEFKTPMTSIQGYAKLIALQESGPLTEQQKVYLDIIQKNIRRINALVDNLIDALPDKASGGKEPGRTAPVSVDADFVL